MTSYTIAQHVQMIKLYYQNDGSCVRTLRALRPFYGRHGGPSKSTLQRLVVKFEATGSVNNQPAIVRQRNARSAENIAAVRESVKENPLQSIPCRARELGLSQTSIWRILHEDLQMPATSETDESKEPATDSKPPVESTIAIVENWKRTLPLKKAIKESYLETTLKREIEPSLPVESNIEIVKVRMRNMPLKKAIKVFYLETTLKREKESSSPVDSNIVNVKNVTSNISWKKAIKESSLQTTMEWYKEPSSPENVLIEAKERSLPTKKNNELIKIEELTSPAKEDGELIKIEESTSPAKVDEVKGKALDADDWKDENEFNIESKSS